MEDQSKYTRRDKPDGLTEVVRIYYNKNETTVEEFLLLELMAGIESQQRGYKLFKAYKPKSMKELALLCNN